jgi:hypothetical protein
VTQLSAAFMMDISMTNSVLTVSSTMLLLLGSPVCAGLSLKGPTVLLLYKNDKVNHANFGMAVC